MGITQIVSKLYKACVLVIGTSNRQNKILRAKQEPWQNQNGLAQDKGVEIPCGKISAICIAQEGNDDSFQICERMQEKEEYNKKHLRILEKRPRGMNLKCKQRRYVNIRKKYIYIL